MIIKREFFQEDVMFPFVTIITRVSLNLTSRKLLWGMTIHDPGRKVDNLELFVKNKKESEKTD